ncbi:MAG: hypothetical protein HUU50_00120 [Candidatus Brocadiae bacterium]|nr:hypothetical protein [Candidatus Brocadiia bacterium]
MNWEIFYCYWQLWTLVYKNVGFYFPKFEFQGIGNSGLVELTKKTLFISKSLEELQLNNRPENHLFFYVMPALFKRAGLKSSRVIFENIESLEDIRFFLVENLWTLLLGTFRSEMPIKTALREIIIPKKRILWQRILGYLQNQEINNTDHDPFFWFFLYGVSSFFPYEKEDRINLREIAEKIIKQFYNTSLGKEDVIYKILNKVLQKKLVFKTKFYFWKRTSSLIPRVYNKLKFRFVHSLFLSILLLLVLIFLNIFIYFIVQEKNFLAILKKITADLILFENSFNK